jgi:hypothetical protein
MREPGRSGLGSSFGALGTIVMVQRGGMLDSCSSTERTKPVTVSLPDFTVAMRPLN